MKRADWVYWGACLVIGALFGIGIVVDPDHTRMVAGALILFGAVPIAMAWLIVWAGEDI